MRTIRTSIVMVASVCLCLATVAVGQRTLERTEVLEIFKELTSQPRETWIPAGTIDATHWEHKTPESTDPTEITREIATQLQAYQNGSSRVELTEELQKLKLDAIPFNVRYKMANEYSMSSSVVVKYDGNRFYWEINVNSRQDSISAGAELAGNYMTDQFDLSGNEKRIFAWDGQVYTAYAASGNHAIVDAANELPRGVNGPLTAGLVAWGHGPFSYERLSAAEVSAAEVLLDGMGQIQMTVVYPEGPGVDLTLDPSKGYAVTSCTLRGFGSRVMTYHCSGYQQVGARWVPTAILVEYLDALTNAVQRSDQWNLNSIEDRTPAPEEFSVEFQADTYVEYTSTVTDSPAAYLYSHSVDTDQLLAERLTYAATRDTLRQNCATVALRQAALDLGKSFSGSALASVVGQTGQTSLYDMKQLAQGAGLYCRAVQTDLATLGTLDGVKAILHIPGKNHFFLLDQVDDRHVWVIDLTSDKFYYRKSVDFFPLEWSDRVALLISDRPIAGSFADIGDAALRTLIGGDGWDCSRIIQGNYVIYCAYVPPGCDGTMSLFWERYGCDMAPSGTCEIELMLRFQNAPCFPDPVRDCVLGPWAFYYMKACR